MDLLWQFATWREKQVGHPGIVDREVERPVVLKFESRVGARSGRPLAAIGLAVLGLLIITPAFAPRSVIQDMIFIFYMLALAQYWNLLAGYAGLVSVGQQAFVGLGAYLLFALTIFGNLDPILAIILAGAV